MVVPVGRKEISHLHGDSVLHLAFSKADWHKLKAEGRIDFHLWSPDKPGFAQRMIEDAEDERDVVALLRLNYDRAASG